MRKETETGLWLELGLEEHSEDDLVDIFYGFYGEGKDEEDLILGLAGIEPNAIEQVEIRKDRIEEIKNKYNTIKEKQKETLGRFKYRRR